MKALVSFVIISLPAVAGATDEIPTLSFRERVIVQSPQKIRLADVVDVSNPTPALTELLNEFELCNAPARGERRTFSTVAFSQIVRKFQTDLERRAIHVRYILPAQVLIERPGRALELEVVREQLLAHWGRICGACRLSISDLKIPEAGGTFHDWELRLNPDLPKGAFSIPVRIQRQETALPETLWIQGRLSALREVPVATRAIYFGERLALRDFRLEYREVTYAADSPPSLEEIVGQRIRSPVRANDVIWRHALEREKALYRGQIVRVRIGDPGFEVTMDGKAEQDGFIGDIVNVKGLNSQKVLSGKVTGVREVMVQ